MIKIEEIKKIDKKHIALMDTSSISFMQSLQNVKPHAVGGGKCGLFSETLRLNRGMISAAAGC